MEALSDDKKILSSQTSHVRDERVNSFCRGDDNDGGRRVLLASQRVCGRWRTSEQVSRGGSRIQVIIIIITEYSVKSNSEYALCVRGNLCFTLFRWHFFGSCCCCEKCFATFAAGREVVGVPNEVDKVVM